VTTTDRPVTATAPPPSETATQAAPTESTTATATVPPIAVRAVTFETPDGVALSGTVYGAGATAVIFAAESDKRQDAWAEVAEAAARAGYLALTFDFRFWGPGSQRDVALMNAADTDLLAAIAFVRAEGAQSVALVGASLGGMAAAKAAAVADPAAVIIIGAPMGHPDLEINVSPAELQAATAPKLFIAAEDDRSVPAAETQAMYELAADPKEIVLYPASQHGTALLATQHGPDLQQRILDFIQLHTQ
jgi:dienelactone hydrolase